MFWNCQSIRLKCKELELYLKENVIDVIALNETFLSKKHNVKFAGYDTIRNDNSTGYRGGVAFLVKHCLVINKEYRNNDFNIITNNEALEIDLEPSNKQNLTLATIYFPNENPNLTLFQTINNLPDNVMFVSNFSLKLEPFSCVKENTYDSMLKNIQKQLNLIQLNNNKHMHIWTDQVAALPYLLDMPMTFVSLNLAKHDIQFQIGGNLGSDHLPTEVSIDAPPHGNSSINHTR